MKTPHIETVSSSTLRNWSKLKTEEAGRLTSRANKRKSKKRIVPLEYFRNLANLDFIQSLLDTADSRKWHISSVILSLAINMLERKKIINHPHVQSVLHEYKKWNVIEDILSLALPSDEWDLLGIFYQSCLLEGQKNIKGSYYTPGKIVRNMLKSFDFSNGRTLLDPCCGSGAFLTEVNAPDPKQLFGIDNDELAVFITKINLLIKYPDAVFIPQIYCLDFLDEKQVSTVLSRQFDYIVTNPPWGAMNSHGKKDIYSGETFSLFFVRAFALLAQSGRIRFLFPESVLNVKAHKDIRGFMLNNTRIVSITKYSEMFSGVTTKYVDIECSKDLPSDKFLFFHDSGAREISIPSIHETDNNVFNLMDDTDYLIVQQIKSKGSYSLKNSIWGLGIVTGDNKHKLFPAKQHGMEKIYTGKEICPYFLKPAVNYIQYDRHNLQQAAKEEIYRAREKLVYKFISDKLVFAYDNSKSLFLNSANILIPNIPNMSIKTVLAFLNSELFRFLYKKLFGEVKILKGNLMELPFPHISPGTDALFSSKVDRILHGEIRLDHELQNGVFDIYGFTPEQIQHIRKSANDLK